nr:protein misato homolog 1 [Anolis sagrei ordinatus]
MAGAREVVTLQLGPYAGCVGAHWWGLQESSYISDSATARSDETLHHNVLFRPGRSSQGQETYTPRLILMDLKGNMGSLKQEGTLYHDTNTDTPVAWKGTLTTHREDPSPVNPFLKGLGRSEDNRSSGSGYSPRTLPGDAERQHEAPETLPSEATAHVWSDFLRTSLHPRSTLAIQQYSHEGDSSQLEAFGQGEKLLQSAAYAEELEDRLHFYVEECDYLQGFQVLCDLHSGFSGIGAKVTELLQDEYAGKGVLTWGLAPMHKSAVPQKNFYRLMNTVLGIVSLSSRSSLLCPLSLNGSLGLRTEPPVTLPHLRYEASLDYHTSAILATALETLTVPYRLQASTISMANLAEALNFSGRKVAAAMAAIPFPLMQGQSLPDALCSQQPAVPWSTMSSCREQSDSHCFAQSVVLRGISKEYQVSRPLSGTEPKSVLHMCDTGQEVLARYLYMASPRTFSTSHLLQSPTKLSAPYPQYFSPLLNKQGFLLEKLPHTSAAVESIPVFTALQSSAVLRRTLRNFYDELHQVDVRRWASFFSAGVETDDFQEALEELRTLSHCYKQSDSAEDSEDDID